MPSDNQTPQVARVLRAVKEDNSEKEQRTHIPQFRTTFWVLSVVPNTRFSPLQAAEKLFNPELLEFQESPLDNCFH